MIMGRSTRLFDLGAAAAIAIAGLGLLWSSPVKAAEPEIVVRAGFTTGPDGNTALDMRLWATLVDVNSGGRMKIEPYHSDLLGDANTQVEGLLTGTHDVFAHISSFTGMIPAQRIWDLPFLFADREVVARVVQGPLRAEMEQQFADEGLVLLGFWENGYRIFANNVRPIRVPEDMKGLKHRITGGKSKTLLFETLGASPSTVAWPELYQAISVGLTDSLDAPLGPLYSAKLYEVTKYISMCPLTYNPQIVVAGQPFWDGLPEWAREILLQSARDVEGWARMRGEIDDLELPRRIAELRPDIEINTCDPADIPKWQEAVQPVYDAFAEEAGQEWADKVLRVAQGGYAE